MKILLTNRINLLGVFIAVLIYSIIYNLIIDDGVTRSFFQAIIASLIFIILYGIVFWIGFLIIIIFLDLILIVPNLKRLKIKLFLEWVIISIPLIYMALTYERQRGLYFVALTAFFITQFLRQKLLKKISTPIKKEEERL